MKKTFLLVISILVVYLSFSTHILTVKVFAFDNRDYNFDDRDYNFEKELEFREKTGLKTEKSHMDKLKKLHDKVKSNLTLTKQMSKSLSSFKNDELLQIKELIQIKKYDLNIDNGVLLTLDEAKQLDERFKFQEKFIEKFVSKVSVTKGLDYSGLYVDQKNNGTIHLLAKNNINDVRKLSNEVLHEIDKQVINIKYDIVKYSEDELNNLTNRLRENKELLEEKGAFISQFYPDLKTNSVVVGINNKNQIHIIQEVLGNIDYITFVDAIDKVEESRTDYTRPISAGLSISETPLYYSGICTSGYSAVKDGVYYIMTAGHCTRDNLNWYQGKEYFGVTRFSLVNTNFDVGAIAVKAADTTREVYGNPYLLTGYESKNNDYVGQTVRKSGMITGISTGFIVSKNLNGTKMRHADYTSSYGDSGAPVYLDTLLKGVHGGSLKKDGKVVGSYYSHVDEIYSSTGFQSILARRN